MPDNPNPTWFDNPAGGTPITALKLNNTESRISIARAIAESRYLAADTFTRADSASLGTAETGQTWTTHTGSFAISGGTATTSTTSTATIEVGEPEVDITCLISAQAGDRSPGVVFHANADSSDRLSVHVDMTNGFRLNKVDDNVTTPLTTQAFTFTPGQSYMVRVVVVDNVIDAYLDGDLLLNHTLSSGDQTIYNPLTRVGLRNFGAGAVFENFVVMRSYPTAGGVTAGTQFNNAMISGAGPFMNSMGMRHTIYYNTTTSTWPSRTVPTGFTGGVIWDSMAAPGVAQPVGMIEGDFWDQRVA